MSIAPRPLFVTKDQTVIWSLCLDYITDISGYGYKSSCKIHDWCELYNLTRNNNCFDFWLAGFFLIKQRKLTTWSALLIIRCWNYTCSTLYHWDLWKHSTTLVFYMLIMSAVIVFGWWCISNWWVDFFFLINC